MDFKKFASDAGTFFSRAKQYTEEKLGHADKTELDAHFENLLQRADKTREWTERIIAQTEAILQPNPGVRVEEFFYDKMDKKKRDRLTGNEVLGQYMIDAGNEFGPGTSYGSTLVKVGQAENKLGQAEKEFIHSAANNFLQPLKAFLEGDMKTLQKERRVLEAKRLDLDSCKGRLRRAKSVSGKDQHEDDDIDQVVNELSGNPFGKAEADVRKAQAEFDRQCEITKLLLEGISSTHAHHLRCLHDFVEAQTTYYAQCHQYMTDLQKQLGSPPPKDDDDFSLGGGISGGGSISPDIHGPIYPSAPTQLNNTTTNGMQSAKVLYDYDAADMSELSLKADEVIMVSSIPGKIDWLTGHRGTQSGRVPATYVQILH